MVKAVNDVVAVNDDDDDIPVPQVVLPIAPVHAPLPAPVPKETKKAKEARERAEKAAASVVRHSHIYRPIKEFFPVLQKKAEYIDNDVIFFFRKNPKFSSKFFLENEIPLIKSRVITKSRNHDSCNHDFNCKVNDTIRSRTRCM